jgi:tetratricopeptide (TPR) repeat protein
VNSLLIGLIGTLMATNQPAAVSNLVYERTGVAVPITTTNDPAEKELEAVMIMDDDAQTEVDKWIRENQEFAKHGAGVPNEELNRRIRARLDSVKKAYEDLIAKYPNNGRAHLAYASFLDDTGDADDSLPHLEKACELDPGNPAAWNNLANYNGHEGDVNKAFDEYTRAIALNPKEPIYYMNFGTTVFLFRKNAMEHYHINEQQVFDKALELYSHARALQPDDFPLATDVAQTYYGIRPWRTNDALNAWTNALNIADSEVEREGVYMHLARLKTAFGEFDEAAAFINSVTNEAYGQLKRTLQRSLRDHIARAAGTNTVPASEDLEVSSPPKETPK